MFQRLSLKTKLIYAFLFQIICMALIGVCGMWGISDSSAKYDHVANINLGNADKLGNMNLASGGVSAELRAYAVKRLMGRMDAAELADAKKKLNKEITDYEKSDKEYQAITFVEGEDALYQKVDAAWKKQLAITKTLMSYFDQPDAKMTQKFNELLISDYDKAEDEAATALDTLTDFQVSQSKTWVGHATSSANMARTLMMITLVIASVLGISIAMFLANSISKALSTVAESLSDGAAQIAAASQQVASASVQLSSSATEQAAALQETSASIEEMSAMITKNADNSSQSQSLAENGRDTALEGKRSIGEMSKAVDEIRQSNSDVVDRVNQTNASITEIVKVITEIGNKTKVINDIVFQTKLLSFNASVEAARAGEHGKGFAVVAEEVGNLAQMSGNAAREISTMLDDSVKKVEGIVEDTKASVDQIVALSKSKIDTGISTAKKCGDSLEEIVEKVGHINAISLEVSNSSQEQAKGIQEITRAMNQLDQVTQQNASASQEASAAAEQMSAQAGTLRTIVGDLMRVVRGSEFKEEHRTETAKPKQKSVATLIEQRKAS